MTKRLVAVAGILLVQGFGASAQSGAELSITVDASAETVVTGSPVTYTLTVTNEGPDAAYDVTVTDILPPETTFVACDANGGICGGEGNNRTVLFPSIAPDTSETITLVALVNCPVSDGEEIANTATVSTPTPDPAADEDENETVFIDVLNPPPVITNETATPSVLWPPNHKMASVTIDYTVVDNCGPVAVGLQVASNEAIDGVGDGHSSPDWEVMDAHQVRLRAERSGNGAGRIYSVAITASDSANQSATRAVAVYVPHSGGR